jgi:23S rRNA pseudouridine1911/1915/1917 synthase
MRRSYEFRVEPSKAGQRLDEFLASRLGSLSRMRIANLIDAGFCVVNGANGRGGYRIAEGDAIEISFEEGSPTSMFPEPISLTIVHEDDHLIVIVKPAGLLVHPTSSVKSGTLANALAYHLNRFKFEDQESPVDHRTSIFDPQPVIRPGLVHRLDRATSGLMVVAKTARALTILSRHFRKRLVEKRYLALVHACLDHESGTIVAPIGRDPDRRPHWRVTEEGKPAETRFKVIEQLDRATLLELEPVTGRTNQLRIHCAHIGHPIVGDESEPGEFAIRNSQPAARLCLHAWKLAFHHPAGGEWREFVANVPEDFGEVVERFRSVS